MRRQDAQRHPVVSVHPFAIGWPRRWIVMHARTFDVRSVSLRWRIINRNNQATTDNSKLLHDSNQQPHGLPPQECRMTGIGFMTA